MTTENPYLNDLLNSLDDSILESPSDSEKPAQEVAEELQGLIGEEGFSAGFADHVMERIADEKSEDSVVQLMPRMFRWIAVAGVAAAAILLVLVFLEGHSLSIDAMTGLSEMSLADELTLEMY